MVPHGCPGLARVRVRPERKDGRHPALCNAPPQRLRMRHQSHQSHQDHQSPAQHTNTITDGRPQQYTRPAGDMGGTTAQSHQNRPVTDTRTTPPRARGNKSERHSTTKHTGHYRQKHTQLNSRSRPPGTQSAGLLPTDIHTHPTANHTHPPTHL